VSALSAGVIRRIICLAIEN